jgi:hypothetical protein
MNTFNRISKPVSYAVITSILTMSLYLPAANAAMVGTEVVVHAAQAEQERSRISAALNREEVKVKLAALGVDAERRRGADTVAADRPNASWR